MQILGRAPVCWGRAIVHLCIGAAAPCAAAVRVLGKASISVPSWSIDPPIVVPARSSALLLLNTLPSPIPPLQQFLPSDPPAFARHQDLFNRQPAELPCVLVRHLNLDLHGPLVPACAPPVPAASGASDESLFLAHGSHRSRTTRRLWVPTKASYTASRPPLGPSTRAHHSTSLQLSLVRLHVRAATFLQPYPTSTTSCASRSFHLCCSLVRGPRPQLPFSSPPNLHGSIVLIFPFSLSLLCMSNPLSQHHMALNRCLH